MTDTTMPVTEAVSHAHDGDVATYELAYHILPTVTEGEVEVVTQELKSLLASHQAVLTDEEAPARFELAYEIEKYLEGRYRRFASAYFGWIRFTLAPAQIATLNEELSTNKKILRHLVVRLTAVEEANPFRFHDAVRELNTKLTTIDTDATIEDEAGVEEVAVAEETEVVADANTDATDTSHA